MLTVGILVCPVGCVTMLRRVLSEEASPRSGFIIGEVVARPLLVVYAYHSRLEHHGVAAGDAAVVLMGAFKLVCGEFRSSNV